MWPGRSSWTEVRRKGDYSILAGRMSVNVEHANWRKAQKGTGCTTVQNGTKSVGKFWRPSESGSKKARTLKTEWKWHRGIVAHPLGESQWNRGGFRMKIWESEKHQSRSMQVEGFRSHVATDGSLLGTAGKWGACGWAVVQLDYDEEFAPLQTHQGPCGQQGEN